MARISVKYPIGKDVEHFTGIHGKVTAITVRDKHRMYEMSYLDGDNPACRNVEECEISPVGDSDFGFKAPRDKPWQGPYVQLTSKSE